MIFHLPHEKMNVLRAFEYSILLIYYTLNTVENESAILSK